MISDTLKLTIVKGHLYQNKRTIAISQCVHKCLEEGNPSALFGKFIEIFGNFQKDLEIVIARKLHLFANKCNNIFPFPIRKVGNRMITTVVAIK